MAKKGRHSEPPRTRFQNPLQPTVLLHFVELNGFSEDWERLGLDDDDLVKLQFQLMEGGKHSPIIAGTGGLRKMRFAPDGWRAGKRGAMRVCFCWLERFGIVLLVTAYAKNEQSDLSARARRIFRQLLVDAEIELTTRQQNRSRSERKQ